MTRHDAIAAIVAADDDRHAEIIERIARIETAQRDMTAMLADGIPPRRRLTRAETAEHYCVSVRTVDTWLAAGAPHMRLGGPGGSPRMDVAELDVWHRQMCMGVRDAAE